MPEFTYNTEVPETDAFGKPTQEEYDKAKAGMQDMARFVRMSRNRQTQLIDELCGERANEKMYSEIYERHKDIVRRYEIYEELEKGKSNG